VDGLTAREVLSELRERFGLELAETEQKSLNKLRDWARRGIIDGPLFRAGVEGTGGRKGLYSKDLPAQLAVILYLRNVWGLTFDTISKARKSAESLRNNTYQGRYWEWNTPRPPLTPVNHARDLWFLYFAKAKAGVEESVKKAKEEKFQLRYEEDRT